MNRLIRQSIELGQFAAEIPFKLVRDLLKETGITGNTEMGKTVEQAINVSCGLATIPFKIAKEMVSENHCDKQESINENEFRQLENRVFNIENTMTGSPV